jgi:alanine-glyoxylate transaminase/serine-glyoxylate transaminase/serine-pyruvate transaminase
LTEIAEAHKLLVTTVPVEVGAPVDPSRVADALDGHDGVLVTHVDTATGVRHPIDAIAQVAHAAGAVCMVDGIASAGGESVDIDSTGIDCFVTASQKGLDGPPGLGILALGAGGRERVAARSEPPETFYLDLKRWDFYRREWGSWHPHPVTMATNLFLALASSVQRIMERGIDAWVRDRAALAHRCRSGLEALGLESVPQDGAGANLVVAMWCDDPHALQEHVMRTQQIMVSGGLAPTAGRAIRIGLMGRTATDTYVERVIAGVRDAL